MIPTTIVKGYLWIGFYSRLVVYVDAIQQPRTMFSENRHCSQISTLYLLLYIIYILLIDIYLLSFSIAVQVFMNNTYAYIITLRIHIFIYSVPIINIICLATYVYEIAICACTRNFCKVLEVILLRVITYIKFKFIIFDQYLQPRYKILLYYVVNL